MRHAFLIIAHNEPYIPGALLDKLKNVPGNIFVHIDKKVKRERFEKLKNVIASGGGKISPCGDKCTNKP